ncbi:hypothetical protein OfM1_14790 [Lactovum odontotermitis]
MTISEATFLDLAKGVYQNSEYSVNDKLGTDTQAKVIGSTSENTAKFESNGLQASIVKVDGQTVVAFRGSQDMDTSMLNPDVSQRTDGAKDWDTDLGLNSAEGYTKDSQFKDADKWLKEQQKSGVLKGVDMNQVTFTGHSLGGALASYEAVRYEAKGVVFSAPSAYNMLTPSERLKVKDANVTNFVQWNDQIPNQPVKVPQIGKKVFAKGSGENNDGKFDGFSWAIGTIVGVQGHYQGSFEVDKNGNIVKDNQFWGEVQNSFNKAGIVGTVANLGPVLSWAESAINGIFSKKTNGDKALEKLMGNYLKSSPAYQVGSFLYSILNNSGKLAVKILGGGSGAAVGRVLLIKDPIDRAASVLLTLNGNLDEIQTANNKIVPNMEEALSVVESTVAGSLGWMGLTIGDVEGIVSETRSDVDYHVDKGAIAEVGRMVSEKREQIQIVASGLTTTAANKVAHDAAWAAAFGGL